MQAFSLKYILAAVLGGLPLFGSFLGVVFMDDLISTSGGLTLPGIGLWSFTIGSALAFVAYTMLFFSRRVSAPGTIKLVYPLYAVTGAFGLIKMLIWLTI